MAETQEKQQTSQQVQNSTSNKTIKLIIKRQKDQNSSPYEESFEIPYRENMNVIAKINGNSS